ncbi:hypothetical protein [Kitasatospora griseola]|uniref:hypothetical protein n=1 Tax=Kitasatospora griseola TaxID=2064 RepID=UPI00167025D6|nr:hypothetical protein [Kitasatospora griseola]GGQ90553.1 hypothetical protein GCM10010195_53090 [Kitasatospora griseola]
MRRLATVLGTLATAATMALALPDAASAATGTLVIAPNQTIENPSGCYNAQIFPLILRNETNEYALVYDGSNCTGQVIAVVPPGGSTTQEFGQSVYIA